MEVACGTVVAGVGSGASAAGPQARLSNAAKATNNSAAKLSILPILVALRMTPVHSTALRASIPARGGKPPAPLPVTPSVWHSERHDEHK